MRALLAVLMLVGVTAAARHDPGDPPCGENASYSGCNTGGSVTVSGTGGSEGSSDNGGGSSGPVLKKWVDCGPQAVAVLRALGDPSIAATTGAACGPAAVAACTAQGAVDGQPRVAQIVLVRQRDGGWGFGGGVCSAAGPPQVTAEMVRDRITRLVPGAAVGVAPEGQTLVNIETVMWVAAPRSRPLPPLTILGRRVTVELALDHVNWSFGDGATTTMTSAGTAYDEAHDPCSTAMCADYWGHVYRDTGAATVSATVAWTASFRVDGGDLVRIPGTVSGPAGRADLTVRQARGVLVPDPGSR